MHVYCVESDKLAYLITWCLPIFICFFYAITL